MIFNLKSLAVLASFTALSSAAAIPSEPQVTQAPVAPLRIDLEQQFPADDSKQNPLHQLMKRKEQNPIAQSVWTSTLANGHYEIVTATIIDGVTISASPAKKTDKSKPTPWISLDGSGIPIAVTPSIVEPGKQTKNASPTPPASYPTANAIPPVLRCFGDRVPPERNSQQVVPGFPFCTPQNATEWLVGETYWITWDPTYYGGSDIKFVRVYARYLPSNGNEDLVWETDWVNNDEGYFPLKVLDDYRIRGTEGYMFINLTPLVPADSNAEHTGAISGPIIRVISDKKDAHTVISRLPSDNRKNSLSTGGSGLSKGQLTAAIVVPIVFVILLGVFVYLWFLMRKKALLNKQTEKAGKGNGVHVPKDASLVSTRTNMSTMTTDTIGETGNNPFHDRHASTFSTEDVELSNTRGTKPTSAV